MNTHNQPDDLIDLSLRHSLKNWAAHEWTIHKNSEPNGREKLLAAAQREISLSRRKPLKINFAWFFRSNETRCEYPIHPINSYQFEYMDFLKTRMAFL